MPDRAANAWRLHHVRSGILVDARDYYRAFYEAASRARRSILLLGWQFDSDVALVRGGDVPAGVDPDSVRLLAFLDGLCAARPELEVRLLAWDHSLWFALEREVLQKLSFDLRTSERFVFEKDATVAEYGAHHQKVAIVDGRAAFLGSADLCQDRWDTSEHAPGHPLRFGRGRPSKPCHEVQAVVTGAAARSLVDMFVERWVDATGEVLEPESLVTTSCEDAPPVLVTVPMPRALVALHRQMPHRLGRPPIREVRDLLVSWIDAAERLVYVETQYLTSQAILDALVTRMRAPDRSKLDVVIVLPHKPEALKEELAIGATQASVLETLSATARHTGHALGVYDVCAGARAGRESWVYVHSKLVVVDDVRLTIGSANLNNRSMSLDSEINVSWTADDPNDEIGRAIAALRVRLMVEHVGVEIAWPRFFHERGLVERLDAFAASKRGRLRLHERASEAPSFLMKIGQRIASAYADPLHSPESRETPLLFDGPAPGPSE
jgi:phosphatidylserine/phosphatidylglycerophosphate/cardiolipin synthase-like enzyme